MTLQNLVLQDVVRERSRQDELFGERNDWAPERWLTILMEEIGEVSTAILENQWKDYDTELIQVAAVAVAALENFRRSKGDSHGQ